MSEPIAIQLDEQLRRGFSIQQPVPPEPEINTVLWESLLNLEPADMVLFLLLTLTEDENCNLLAKAMGVSHQALYIQFGRIKKKLRYAIEGIPYPSVGRKRKVSV